MANNKFTAAVKRAKGLYKTGRYKTFADAVKAAYKKGKTTKRKKVGATLLIERKETRRTKPKRVVRITRTKTGTFKKMQRIGSAKLFNSMAEVKAANKKAGHFFFSPGTMKFFDSKVVTPLIQGQYFITSEKFTNSAGHSSTTFSIRKAMPDGSINADPYKKKFQTKKAATAFLKKQLR